MDVRDSALIGLAGVVVGSVITAVATRSATKSQQREQRRLAALGAASEIVAALAATIHLLTLVRARFPRVGWIGRRTDGDQLVNLLAPIGDQLAIAIQAHFRLQALSAAPALQSAADNTLDALALAAETASRKAAPSETEWNQLIGESLGKARHALATAMQAELGDIRPRRMKRRARKAPTD